MQDGHALCEATPADEHHQRVFQIVPIPFDFGVHLQLFYGLGVVDVVGDCVAEGVGVGSDEVPSAMSVVQVIHGIQNKFSEI